MYCSKFCISDFFKINKNAISLHKINNLAHSEEYFTEDRNYWFNDDFLDLMAKRWQLNQYQSILDIGAGQCYWTKLLVPYMKPNARITALDSDPKWSKGSKAIQSHFKKLNATIEFIKGDAHDLPFEDNSFDVVTCQTLLIHVKKPFSVLQEMKRVVKNDGIVICSEPNNRIQSLIQDTSNQHDTIETIVQRVRTSLAAERHKIEQQQGNNSFGDLLTGAMNELGFNNIQSYLNDKLLTIYPPYDSIEQQARINTFLKWGKSKEEIEDFDEAYNKSVDNNSYTDFLKNFQPTYKGNTVIKGIKKQNYANGGATLLYLISGNK